MGLKKLWRIITGETEKISWHIQNAAQTGELDLSGRGLTEIPPEVWQLTNLNRLDLEVNKLTAVPPQIAQLTNLQKLYLSANHLTAVPPEIGQLTNLQSLVLRRNQLTAVPPAIGQLTNLQWLDLNHNQLTVISPELCQLTNLQYLDLRGNPALPIPTEILDNPYNPTSILNYIREFIPNRFTVPLTQNPFPSPKPSQEPDRRQLRQTLTQKFSPTELKILCFDLHIEYDHLTGQNHPEKVVELIKHIERNGRLPELIRLVQQHRPPT